MTTTLQANGIAAVAPGQPPLHGMQGQLQNGAAHAQPILPQLGTATVGMYIRPPASALNPFQV